MFGLDFGVSGPLFIFCSKEGFAVLSLVGG